MKKPTNKAFLLGPPVPEDMFYVYALYCPVARQLRYIGSTAGAPLKRYASHLTNAKAPNEGKEAWIAALKAVGLRPYMRVLKWFDNYDDARAWEDCMIVAFQWRRALCNKDKRFNFYSRFSETTGHVCHWFNKALGAPLSTDWASLKPDPLRQRLPASLRVTLRSTAASTKGNIMLLELTEFSERQTRSDAPDFRRLEAAKLLNQAKKALFTAAALLEQASKY